MNIEYIYIGSKGPSLFEILRDDFCYSVFPLLIQATSI